MKATLYKVSQGRDRAFIIARNWHDASDTFRSHSMGLRRTQKLCAVEFEGNQTDGITQLLCGKDYGGVFNLFVEIGNELYSELPKG